MGRIKDETPVSSLGRWEMWVPFTDTEVKEGKVFLGVRDDELI